MSTLFAFSRLLSATADARGSFAVEGARVAREVVEALLRTEEYAHAKTQVRSQIALRWLLS